MAPRTALGSLQGLKPVETADLRKRIGPLPKYGALVLVVGDLVLRATVRNEEVQRWIATDENGDEVESLLYLEPTGDRVTASLYVYVLAPPNGRMDWILTRFLLPGGAKS